MSEHIATVPREGYRFVPVPVEPAAAFVVQDPPPPPERPRGLAGLLLRLGYHVGAGGDQAPSAPSFVPADLRIDETGGMAWYRDAAAKLTRLEQRLLRVFVEQPDTVLHKADLIVWVWGEDAPADDNCLTQLVSRLRRSLHPLGLDDRVVAIPRVGYRFNMVPEGGTESAPAADFKRPGWNSTRFATAAGGLVAMLLAFAGMEPLQAGHAEALVARSPLQAEAARPPGPVMLPWLLRD